MILAIGGFLGCSALIFYHGTRLSYYGDFISVKSGLGKAWVGRIRGTWNTFFYGNTGSTKL